MPKPALDIIYQDADFVAVNKPAGLASIPGRHGSRSVLTELARQLDIPFEGITDLRLRVLHRLDRDTTGVQLFALNKAAQRHVSQQFQTNRTAKQYLALVAGAPLETTGEIDAPLARHPTVKQRMTVVRHSGRPAKTQWQLERKLGPYSLLRVFPKTGKTHQIRVHLKLISLPLAVDPLYNPPPRDQEPGIFLSTFKRSYRPSGDGVERPLIGRLTLHAQALGFEHLDGRKMELTAPLHKDFRATLNMLEKHARR